MFLGLRNDNLILYGVSNSQKDIPIKLYMQANKWQRGHGGYIHKFDKEIPHKLLSIGVHNFSPELTEKLKYIKETENDIEGFPKNRFLTFDELQEFVKMAKEPRKES